MYRETTVLCFFLSRRDSRDIGPSVGIAGRAFFSSQPVCKGLDYARGSGTPEFSFVLMLNKGGRRKKYINGHPASRFFPRRSPLSSPSLLLSHPLSHPTALRAALMW